MWTYFQFWPMKIIFRKLCQWKFINESLIMACLQTYRELFRLLLFSEFIQTQKRYPTCLGKVRILTSQQTFQRWFNVVFWLYNIATWDNVKSTLKQRCGFQHWNLQRRTQSNQRCVFQLWYEQRQTTPKQRFHFQHWVSQCW